VLVVWLTTKTLLQFISYVLAARHRLRAKVLAVKPVPCAQNKKAGYCTSTLQIPLDKDWQIKHNIRTTD